MNRFWKEYFIFMEKKTNTLKKALTGIILSVILIVIDQVTKLMAIHGLMNQQPFVIWDTDTVHRTELFLVWNTFQVKIRDQTEYDQRKKHKKDLLSL